MKENSSSAPRLFTLATALFDTGAGSGSNLGTVAVRRKPAREMTEINPKRLFIPEDSSRVYSNWIGQTSDDLGNCASSGRNVRIEAMFLMRSRSRQLGGWPILISVVIACTSTAAQSPNPTLEIALQHGRAALETGDYTHATDDFERARQLAPDNLQVNRGLL